MKRITDEWISQPNVQKVCSALEQAGARVLFVGGCVRDTILKIPISDIDIATDMRPLKTIKIAEDAGLYTKHIAIAYGVVRIFTNDRTAFDVTGFRRDIMTDKQNAFVSFSAVIEEDARRRDFTMNALYAKTDGTILDPLNVMSDVLARRLRFIGKAEDRIREDYLRSLRYFRFHAWYNQGGKFDDEALKAISENLNGIPKLSYYRIGNEMLKLLAAPDPEPCIVAMQATGVLECILPEIDDSNISVFRKLLRYEREAGAGFSSIRRLAALVPSDDSDIRLQVNLMQSRHLMNIQREIITNIKPIELGYRYGADTGLDIMLLRAANSKISGMENSDFFWKGIFDDLKRGEAAQSCFPLEASDLPFFSGPELEIELRKLETRWINSGFSFERDELLGKQGISDHESGPRV